MLTFAMFMSACGAVIVMSSAYVVSCTESGGSGMSVCIGIFVDHPMNGGPDYYCFGYAGHTHPLVTPTASTRDAVHDV